MPIKPALIYPKDVPNYKPNKFANNIYCTHPELYTRTFSA